MAIIPKIRKKEKDKTSKTDDVLTEHGGLLLDLPLAVHLRFFLAGQVGGTTLNP